MKAFWGEFMNDYTIAELMERGVVYEEPAGSRTFWNPNMGFVIKANDGQLVWQLQLMPKGDIMLVTDDNPNEWYRYPSDQIKLAIFQHVE